MKPKIICHMMSSVDGRLIAERWTPLVNGKNLDDATVPYYEVSNQLGGDAWMIGRKTVQQHYFKNNFTHSNNPVKNPETFIGKRESERAVIVIDPKGKILYDDYKMDGDNIITILSEQVSEEYLSFLREKGISYLFAGKDGRDIEKAMETLGNEFGMTKILLEGGGIINGTFLKAKLIDELSLQIFPGIDALAGIPAIFEYIGEKDEQPADGQRLELTSCEQLADGIVWLYYKIHK